MSTPRPIIGITTDHDRACQRHEVVYGYVRAIAATGGVPLLLPFTDPDLATEMLARVDGLLFTGGNDPDPAAWGEAWHPACVPVDPAREAFERRLLRTSQEAGTPVLGVCFGMQLMNLVRGGSLIQFLPDMPGLLEHRRFNEEDWARRHDVVIAAGSVISGVCGCERLAVNTNHRQAVGTLGRGLVASGRAPDGIVEVIEDPSLPMWLGVQWHPERLLTESSHRRLFETLVKRARERKRNA